MEMIGRRLVDLSVTIGNREGRRNPSITYSSHEETARERAESFGFDPADLPVPGVHFALEQITAYVHGSGTHVDAPWHYGPRVGGAAARSIEELPLEWFFGPGVVLDCSSHPGDVPIEAEHLQAALQGHELQRGDIVLVRTDGEEPDPWNVEGRPEMNRSAGEFLLDHGVRVMGVDAPSPDRSHYADLASGKTETYFPVHTLGRSRDLCIVELLTNLHLLPHHGFEVALFPIKVERGSGGWCRAVAFVPAATDPGVAGRSTASRR
jgi:kynurenine formamidase